MSARKNHSPKPRSGRPAFTLVEMLVATALTVLIMLMFAQIYGTAMGTMSNQRGMGNNDQRARIIGELILGDLQYRTYRQPGPAYGNVRGIVPMSAGDEPLVDPLRQQGYFYFAENEPDVDHDDVLQFTTWVPVNGGGNSAGTKDPVPYIGRAANLGLGQVNEPELDDGFPGNARGRSRAAEVSYFLRGGNLYRRILLIRDPLQADQPVDSQPTYGDRSRRYRPGTLFQRNYTTLAYPFWNDFDYSATRVFDDPTDANSDGMMSYLWFNSLASLKNDKGTTNHPIALPWNRFGHLNNQADFYNNTSGMTPSDGIPDTISHGMPREWLNGIGAAPPTDYFLGRLTHTETSASAASYPGYENAASTFYTMFDRVNGGGMTYDPTLNTIVELSDGARVAEDLVAASVEAFDIKVWDARRKTFVDLGFAVNGASPYAPTYDFDHQGNGNKWYGSRLAGWGGDGTYGTSGVNDDGIGGTDDILEFGWPGSDDTINRVFDTWHPNATLPTGTNRPPFRPLIAPPNNVTNFARGTQWAPSWAYTLGTINPVGIPIPVVHFPLAGWDQNSDGFIDTVGESGDANGNGQVDPPENLTAAGLSGALPDRTPRNYSIGYRVIVAGTSGSTRPNFPLVPGTVVKDGSVLWECFDNRVGLTAIQITLRYKDIQTGLARQVTYEHSFVE